MSDNFSCSFCNKSSEEVGKLISGPDKIFICDECIDVCNEVLRQDLKVSQSNSDKKITPETIHEFLNQYVIGQENAKIALSVSVYNHYKRINSLKDNDIELEKSNICVIGNSGSGKTLLAQTIARFLDVPFAISDATSLTETGYIGDDVESIIGRLYTASGQNLEKTQKGIVFIDEIDKLKRTNSPSGGRDVSGEGVQQGLLKLLEGSEISVPVHANKKVPSAETIKINTKNILFICGGAFSEIDKIVDNINDNPKIGFGVSKPISVIKNIEPEHLVKFGMIPELVGRLPIITTLDDLTESQLVQILVEPKNAIIKQYKKIFKMDGVNLDFDADALIEIAKQAKLKKTGARGLRGILEKMLMNVQYKLPSLSNDGINRVVITKSCVISGSDPIYKKKRLKKQVSD